MFGRSLYFSPFFHFTIRFTVSDYRFGIFKLFLHTVYDCYVLIKDSLLRSHALSWFYFCSEVWDSWYVFLFKLIRCILCISFFFLSCSSKFTKIQRMVNQLWSRRILGGIKMGYNFSAVVYYSSDRGYVNDRDE